MQHLNITAENQIEFLSQTLPFMLNTMGKYSDLLVCEKMMHQNELKVRGMFIGHYVLEKTYCMYYHTKKDPKLTHPGKRFFYYRNVSVPHKDE